MATRLVRGLVGLASLAPGWGELRGTISTPMQEHAWVRAAAEAFGSKVKPLLVVVGPDEAPRAVAPLGLRRGDGGRLEPLGADLHEPVDLLWTDDASLDELAGGLARLGRPLVLPRFPLESPPLRALRKAFGRGVVVEHARRGLPVIELDDSWADPEQRVGSGRRSDLRRARRRAEQVGEVALDVREPGPADVEALLAEALAVEAASWKGEHGTALAQDTLRLGFYQRYAAEAAAAGTLRICFLRVGGRAAAMQLALECRNRWWLLKIGYDPEFARASPGQLLLLETIRHAAARGLDGYEFLGSSSAWTRAWTDDERPYGIVRIYPLRPRSLPAAAGDALTLALKRVRRR